MTAQAGLDCFGAQHATLGSMSTPRSFQYEYGKDADAVAAVLRNPEFLRWRAEANGDRDVEVKVEGDRVTVARTREVNLPTFAKKMFGSVNRVTDSTVWTQENGRWVGRYEINISGIPGEVKGSISLVPSASGCRFESAFEVTSKVPLFASKLESFMADKVEETLRANAERNAQYLAS
jgi:hypothetical protein